jgi:hypothetical protein
MNLKVDNLNGMRFRSTTWVCYFTQASFFTEICVLFGLSIIPLGVLAVVLVVKHLQLMPVPLAMPQHYIISSGSTVNTTELQKRAGTQPEYINEAIFS